MLVNVHGHIGYMKGATTGKEHYSRENVLDHLRRSAYYGVGAFQSLGTERDGLELQIRDEQRAGTLSAPDLALLLTANQGFVAPTPGSVNGGPFFAVDVVHEATGPDQARQLVRTVAARTPDIIKLWVDDRNGTKKKLTPDVYRAIIDEAHRLGLRTVAHVYYLEDAKDLVRAGIDGFAHMVRAAPGVDAELARTMKARDVFACSTMSIQKAVQDGAAWLDDPALAESVRPEAIAQWKAEIAKAKPEAVAQARAGYAILERSLNVLVAAGVRVTLCGDTGLLRQTPGFTEHRELEAMAQAGMEPLEVIRAATQVGAAILGLTDRGTLAPGKRADFVVLDANPLERMANSRRISAVYHGGVAVDRAALRARWTGAAPAVGTGIGQPR
jgi:imidazolonepropionase-like amidohydrolase